MWSDKLVDTYSRSEKTGCRNGLLQYNIFSDFSVQLVRILEIELAKFVSGSLVEWIEASIFHPYGHDDAYEVF